MQKNKAGAYILPNEITGDNNDVGRVPNGCCCASDVGEDHFGNEHWTGVKVQHLTKPA